LAFVSSGYLLKNKARFLGYSGITIILIIGLISNEFENIQVNNSIVLGGIGLGFLMVRYLITNPKSKIMEIIASTKERFEDKNNQRLS
jgi:hypothetical protein